MWKRSICCLSCLLMLGATPVVFGDLVGRWTFDDGSTSQIVDESGMGNTGTVSGSPTVIDGAVGKALQFHGLGSAVGGGDSINCGQAACFDITSNISIAMWIMPEADNPEGKGSETAPMCKALSSASVSWSWQVRYGWGSTKPYMAFTFNTSPRAWAYVGRNLTRYEWVHIACAHDGATLRSYVNGVEAESTAMGAITVSPTPVIIGSDGWGSDWIGGIDDVRIYNHCLTPEEIAEMMAGSAAEVAKEPVPEDKATDVLCTTSLNWTAGDFAATHDVYLGTAFDDVNNATRDDAKGVLVSQGQAETQYTPADKLAYGQTYYWRVDEVNAAPDSTIFKGLVWSFTVEPFGYPIANITATASSSGPDMGPENTINGSGLDDMDQHSTEATQMWMSKAETPIWIQYEFDKVYKLDELWVWNSNQMVEPFVGFGAKSVTIEYSTDGAAWTTLEGVPEFARAPGSATYTANTTIDFGGVMAKYVKLSINSNQGGVTVQSGLAEVRFFYVPVQAYQPDPADDATGVAIDSSFSWRPGREATSHVVYFGADSAAVADGTAASKTVTETSYTPAAMALGAAYYWRVDEVGAAGTVQGDVWNFTSQEFAAIDDFEAYNDDDNRIYDSWIDGLANKASGSIVGYDSSPFAEKTIVHGGSQAMPLRYDNTASPYYSEAERTFDSAQNWTAHEADSLCLFFRGLAANSAEGFYLTVKDTAGKSKTVAFSNAAAAQAVEWQQWKIPLSDFTAAGVKVTAVDSLVVGVGNRTAPAAGGTGTVYIDDIGYGRAAQ
ncbi:MAG: LamG-like jellyroll fold domain-containing protein [Solirubrobacterales bacterium]